MGSKLETLEGSFSAVFFQTNKCLSASTPIFEVNARILNTRWKARDDIYKIHTLFHRFKHEHLQLVQNVGDFAGLCDIC